MAFMEKQTYTGTYYEVDTNEGTYFVPAEVCGHLSDMPVDGTIYSREDADTPESAEIWEAWEHQIGTYVPASVIVSIQACEGTLYRLSAPGYLDCTEWTTDPDSPEFDTDESED